MEHVPRARRLSLWIMTLAMLSTPPAAGQDASLVAGAANLHPVGSWRVNVAPELPGDPVFVNLAVLHLDGTMVGFPPASPAPDGTFLSGSTGVWRRASSQTFNVTFYSTMYNGDVLVGYQRVRARIRLSSDGNQFHGRFTNDILDPQDNVLASIDGTVTAKRIVE